MLGAACGGSAARAQRPVHPRWYRPAAVGVFDLRSVDARCFSAPSLSAGWPTPPFDHPHPVRSGFNDPRTGGAHFGIDIEAPDGADVHAEISGRVVGLRPTHITIGAEHVAPHDWGTANRYSNWHVRPVRGLAVGDFVWRGEVIGTVVPGFMHVHLSEWVPGCGWVDPRRPGGQFGNPADTERPAIGHFGAFPAVPAGYRAFSTSGTSVSGPPPEQLSAVHGDVDFRGQVSDLPSDRTVELPQLPLMPSAVRGFVAPLGRPELHLGPVWVFDGAGTMTSSAYFQTMAPGTTRRKTCLFHHGPCVVRYVFHLAGHGFDTRRLQNGPYLICAQAITIENHAARRCHQFVVDNPR